MAARWTERPDLLDYVVESYAGVEGEGRNRRRVWIWNEPNGEIRMGNTEAFAAHLVEHFELLPRTVNPSQIHKLMRDLGEQVKDYPAERAERGTAGTEGQYQAPQPDSWVIGHAEPETEQD